MTGFSNSGTAGYIAGGTNNSGSRVTTVDKFAFPAETRSTLGTGLATAKTVAAGFSDTGVAGYVAGGIGNRSTVEKFSFTNDSRSSVAGGLSSSREGSAGFQNEAL